MRINDIVKIKSTGRKGRIISIVEGTVTHIKDIETGEVLNVVNEIVTLVGIIKSIIRFVFSIFGKKR